MVRICISYHIKTQRMKKLSEIYLANGKNFKVLRRTGDVVIAGEIGTRWPLYEVFIVQRQKAGEMFGTAVEAKELPPSNSQWKYYGWQWPSTYKDKAWERFKEEVNKRKGGTKGVQPSSKKMKAI
jgi:hypothetical protein